MRSCLVVVTAGGFFIYSFIQMTLFSTETIETLTPQKLDRSYPDVLCRLCHVNKCLTRLRVMRRLEEETLAT